MVEPPVYAIALPTPLRKTFDYLAGPLSSHEQSTVLPGCRVRVSFGRQDLVGVVVEVKQHSDLPRTKLKAIQAVLDDTPLLPQELIRLCLWAASYYHHPLGEVLSAAIPVALRQGSAAQLATESSWQLTDAGIDASLDSLNRAPKQKALLLTLREMALQAPANGVIWHKDLLFAGINRTQLQALSGRGYLVEEQRSPALNDDINKHQPGELRQPAQSLNFEQQQALDKIDAFHFGVHLLYGTTGSGKTEVYLQLIQKILQQGKQALLLIPEIGLTPQTVARFQQRFQCSLVVIHSGLNDNERQQAWLLAARGLADIVIGTRSAIFTPMKNPGVIIIDEEHDPSFKQQDGFRYSARDLAAVRCQQLDIPLLLGSATPSLESLHNAQASRYQQLTLTQRAGGAQLPTMFLLDIRRQALQEGFSKALLEEVSTHLESGNQVLVFINRRGFAPTLMCHDCGWLAQCPACDARLTVHNQPTHLHCHHCDYQRPLYNHCPNCNSRELHCLGQGTERAEQFLQSQFSEYPVIRVDRDSTRRKHAMTSIFNDVHRGEPCILVGTQMLAKGHHFPDVTLVAVLDLDSGLYSTDFRGPERTGQMLLQVAGRAGRAEKLGQVMIQTHLPDHPLLRTLLEQGYSPYANKLLEERQQTGMPPYRFMALIRAESKRPENAWEFLRQVRHACEQENLTAQLLGPLPAPMERRNDRYRYQLQIISEHRPSLQKSLHQWIPLWEQLPLAKRTRWSIDIDPIDMT